MASDWWQYVERVSQGSQQRDISLRTGIDKSHVSQWKTRDATPSAHLVIKFARAYGHNVLEALVAAGYITEAEAALRKVHVGLHEHSLEDLLKEALHRVQPLTEPNVSDAD